MRLLGILVVVGCGASSSHTVTLEGWQHSFALSHERHQKACMGGNELQCYLYGAELLHVRVEYVDDHPDWQMPWPVDRDGAKKALVTSCGAAAFHKYRFDACDMLLGQKLVTPEEGFAMCTAPDNPAMAMCGKVAKVGTFDEHQWYQLCVHTGFLCDDAMPHLTDAADKAFADMADKFNNVGIKITGYAAHYGADDDDDDDSGGASASTDLACHKDTDCKGERICQAGSCVDPGTKPAKAASLGVAECDQVAQLIETRVFSCSNLTDQALRDAYQTFKDAWGKVAADRRPAMAPICKEQIDRVNADLEHVHCN